MYKLHLVREEYFVVFSTDIFFNKLYLWMLCRITPKMMIRMDKKLQNDGEDILPCLEAIFLSRKGQSMSTQFTDEEVMQKKSPRFST
jgi:hypothetical protein